MHPDAYVPRRKITADWKGLLIQVAFITIFLVVAVQQSPLLAVIVGVVVAIVVIRSLVKRWTGQPPVVVDEPGILFGEAGDGQRLVPWQSVTAVVLFEVPRTDSTSRNSGRRWQSAIGVRLAGYPDGVSAFRPLAGWSLDRAALERAVTRFGGSGVQVVDGARTNSEPTAGQVRAEARRIVTEGMRDAESLQDGETPAGPADQAQKTPRIIWHRTARYQPEDPGAYLARFDLRSNLTFIVILAVVQVFLWALVVPQAGVTGVFFAVVFALPFLLIWRSLRSGGAVALAIDRRGVFFGESHSPGDDQDHRMVTWAQVTAVVVYEQLVRGDEKVHWQRAVGVRLRGEPNLVRHWRIIDGWRLDRPALEAAVARFAPDVPVLDGPPSQPPSSGGVMRALFDAGREVYREKGRPEGWGPSAR